MNIVGSSSVKLHTQGLENLKAYQGDSHKQNELTSQKFDLIFGCNLIDRLQYPRQWLLQSKVREAPFNKSPPLFGHCPFGWGV